MNKIVVSKYSLIDEKIQPSSLLETKLAEVREYVFEKYYKTYDVYMNNEPTCTIEVPRGMCHKASIFMKSFSQVVFLNHGVHGKIKARKIDPETISKIYFEENGSYKTVMAPRGIKDAR